MMRFDVFGREIGVLREGNGWRTVYVGPEGKHRPAHVAIPANVEPHELARFLADLFHESASPSRPDVVVLEGPDGAETPGGTAT